MESDDGRNRFQTPHGTSYLSSMPLAVATTSESPNVHSAAQPTASPSFKRIAILPRLVMSL
jgi:hypothetical protein